MQHVDAAQSLTLLTDSGVVYSLSPGYLHSGANSRSCFNVQEMVLRKLRATGIYLKAVHVEKSSSRDSVSGIYWPFIVQVLCADDLAKRVSATSFTKRTSRFIQLEQAAQHFFGFTRMRRRTYFCMYETSNSRIRPD